MRVRIFPSLLGAAVLAFAIAPAAAAPNDLAKTNLEAAQPYIDRANREWIGAMRGGDAEALAAPYAEDGVFVLSDGRQIVGRAAITAFYRQRLAGLARVLDGGIHHDGMALARDGLVYEWGHGGATTVDKAGKQATSDGPYLTVWRRQADGRWAIVRNLVF